MTICAISDTHGKHEQLDLSKYPADVLVHAGDWTAGRDIGFNETEDFLQWLEEQPFKHKILIAGNHEVTVEKHQAIFKSMVKEYDVIYLQDSSVTIDGVNFYGSPYSNEFYNWAFMDYEVGLSKIWAKIPEDTNVLITHGPAYGCNDLVKNAYDRDPHVGSKSLSRRKKALKDNLRWHISGHIHEARGISNVGGIQSACPSILDHNYKFVNEPLVLEL